MSIDLEAIRQRADAAYPLGWDLATMLDSAQDVPALLAEVDRLNGIIAELKQTGGLPVDEVWERWRAILARADVGSSHA